MSIVERNVRLRHGSSFNRSRNRRRLVQLEVLAWIDSKIDVRIIISIPSTSKFHRNFDFPLILVSL